MKAHRRDEIEVAFAAYNITVGRRARLTPTAIRLLLAMFPTGDICQRSLEDLLSEGFDRGHLVQLLGRLIDAGFLSKERSGRRLPNVYRLHLPPPVRR